MYIIEFKSIQIEYFRSQLYQNGMHFHINQERCLCLDESQWFFQSWDHRPHRVFFRVSCFISVLSTIFMTIYLISLYWGIVLSLCIYTPLTNNLSMSTQMTCLSIIGKKDQILFFEIKFRASFFKGEMCHK